MEKLIVLIVYIVCLSFLGMQVYKETGLVTTIVLYLMLLEIRSLTIGNMGIIDVLNGILQLIKQINDGIEEEK